MFPCHGISDGSCPYFDRVSHLFSFIYFCGIFSSSIIYYQVLFTTISVQVRAFVVNDLTTKNHTGLMDTILFSYSLVVLISQSINQITYHIFVLPSPTYQQIQYDASVTTVLFYTEGLLGLPIDVGSWDSPPISLFFPFFHS